MKDMQHYKNVIKTNLLPGFNPDDLILDVIPPPELHCLMGVVNKVKKTIFIVKLKGVIGRKLKT